MTLVSLERAKEQLKINHDAEDVRIEEICEEATDIVVQLLKAEALVTGSPPEWDQTTVPTRVRAAILRTIVFLYKHRGEDDGNKGLMNQIDDLIRMDRLPSIA